MFFENSCAAENCYSFVSLFLSLSILSCIPVADVESIKYERMASVEMRARAM
jgi:hypothetical protein